jgi:hypothetical protein
MLEQDGEIELEVMADFSAGEARIDFEWKGEIPNRNSGRYQPSCAFHERRCLTILEEKRSSDVVSMSKQKELCFGECGEELLLERGSVGEVIGVRNLADRLERFKRVELPRHLGAAVG